MRTMHVSEIRGQLEIARELAKMGVDFVVIPPVTEYELTQLARLSAENLEMLTKEADNTQGNLFNEHK